VGRRLTIEDTYDLRIPTQVAVSPDGGEVAYVLRADYCQRIVDWVTRHCDRAAGAT
jgi:hypothetical protein